METNATTKFTFPKVATVLQKNFFKSSSSDRETGGKRKGHKQVCFQKYASLGQTRGKIISNQVNPMLFLHYSRYCTVRIKLEEVKWQMLQSTSKLSLLGFVGGW